jgi:hypothetical protein
MHEFIQNTSLIIIMLFGIALSGLVLVDLPEDSIASKLITPILIIMCLGVSYFVCSRPYP